MNPKVKTTLDAIDIIANQAKTAGHVNSPDAYFERIKQNLKRDHWQEAMDILTEEPDMTAEALAEHLQPSNVTPIRPTGRPEIPTFVADEWEPPEPDEVTRQKAHIEAIRARLK